jgi:hypothetical protein
LRKAELENCKSSVISEKKLIGEIGCYVQPMCTTSEQEIVSGDLEDGTSPELYEAN